MRKLKKGGKIIEGKHAVKISNSNVEDSKEVRIFKEEPYYVVYKRSKTINLGNYESEKIDIGITVPCKKGEEGRTLALAMTWVAKNLKKAVEKLNG